MAYFAQLENNIVQQVISISNNEAPDPAPINSEPLGQAFIAEVLKLKGTWKQTSYNGKFRKNYAGIGYNYNEDLDAFIPPQPFPSWTLNESKYDWEAPIEYPNDGNSYIWNEETGEWIQIVLSKE